MSNDETENDGEYTICVLIIIIFLVFAFGAFWLNDLGSNKPIKVPVGYIRCGEYMVPPIKDK